MATDPDEQKPENDSRPEGRDKPASPYGPQPYGPDEAAGGADSSPFDDMSSDERERYQQAKRAEGGHKGPD